MRHYIYTITDPRSEQVFYVGKGTGSRARVHLNPNTNTSWNPFLYRIIAAIRQDGLEPRIDIVSKFDDHNAALVEETRLISSFRRRCDGGNLANLTLGGQGSAGYKFTESQIQSLRVAHTGKTQTDETKRKKSESLKGIIRSDATKAKMSEAKKGPKNPMFGKTTWITGKTHTDESRTLIRESRAKQVISEETRQRMSLSGKVRWARIKASRSGSS